MKFPDVNTKVAFNRISVYLVAAQFYGGVIGVQCDQIQQDKCVVNFQIQVVGKL